MSKDKMSMKGKLGNALKKVFSFIPWTTSNGSSADEDEAQMVSKPLSSATPKVSKSPASETQKTRKGFLARLDEKMGRTSKVTPAGDVHEPLTKPQTVSTPSSSQTKKVSKSPATETKKTKNGFLARLQRKMFRKKTALDQSKHVTQLGGAGMMSDSDTPAQTDKDYLEDHPTWEKSIYFDTDKNSKEDQEYDSRDSDEEENMSSSASFTNFKTGVRGNQGLYVLKELLDPIEEEEEEEGSHDPPKKKQHNNDVRGNMGLPNIGNTCYMNSTLQCILNIPAIIKDIIFQKNVWNNVPGSELFNALSNLHYARLKKTSIHEKFRLLEKVKDQITRGNPDFEGEDQQDAHEFLLTLLDQLKEEAVKCQHLEESFHNPVAHLEFRVNRICTCRTCGNQSCKTDELNSLALVIGPQNSLIESLQQYFTASLLEFNCSKCEGKQASLDLKIQTLPKILVLLVTRFDMLTAEKIKNRVAVPKELNLSSFLESHEKPADWQREQDREHQDQDDTTYKLNGVVSHYGSSVHGGHFVSNIRDPSGPGWLLCDDSLVKSVSWSGASNNIEKNGYMFFYVRS